jgi:calcineurin-like phosphoesterase family protein
MNNALIANWNNTVTNSDTVYYLGDFCFTQDSNVYTRYMHKVNGNVVFLRGNHDKWLQHANYYIWRKIEGLKIFMRHWPPWVYPQRQSHNFNIPPDIDLILCGHVHDKWKFHVHTVGERRIPVVNVGVDVWDYKPINLDDIKNEVDKLIVSKRRGR